MNIRQIIFFLLFAFGTVTSSTQSPTFSSVEHLVKIGEYEQAIEEYDQMDIFSNPKAIFYKGYCHFKIRELEKAENHFLAAYNLKYKDHQLLFLMGQIRQAQGEYKEATVFYKQAFKDCKNDSDSKRIINALNSCSNSEKMEFNKSGNKAINLGKLINSSFDETHPLPSPTNDGLIYFSSTKLPIDPLPASLSSPGKRTSEIFKAKVSDFLVLGIDFASEKIRSDQDEYLLDITEDGKVLFFLQGDQRKDIRTDTFSTESINNQSLAILNSIVGSTDPCEIDVFQDSIFIFSSNKPDGFGGHDLYFSVKRGDTWLDGINMGPQINSSFDEISPYLAKGGKNIYFSSNRTGGLGGFDVYISDYSDIEQDWTTPKNAQVPINSSQDDLNFKVSLLNPKSAYISSNRLLNNFGGYDIYQIALNEAAWTTYSNNTPAFFSQFMTADYTEKVFKHQIGDQILSIGDKSRELFIQDSLRLIQLEQERIDKEQATMDSLVLAKELKDAQRIQDSILLVQIEVENIRKQQQIRDSLLNIQIENDRLAEELRIQDSLAVVQIEIEKQEAARIKREQFVRDSLDVVKQEVARIKREQFVRDSLDVVKQEAARIKREQFVRDSLDVVKQEVARIKREQFVRDSLDVVKQEAARIKREQFVRDSLDVVKQEAARIKREQFVRDSLDVVKQEVARIKREQFVRDSLDVVKQEAARIKREQFVRDSLDVVKQEAARIKREQFVRDSLTYVQIEKQKLLREQQVEDSLLTIRLQEEKHIREQEVQDSLLLVEKHNKELMRLQFIQDSIVLVELEETKRLREQEIQDSLLLANLEEEKLIEAERIQDSILRAEELASLDTIEFMPLNFHTIILESNDKNSDLVLEHSESINILYSILESYPNAIAEIEGFHPMVGPSKVYDLFGSIEKAGQLKDELISLGIDESKIILKGHGSRFNDMIKPPESQTHSKILVRVFNTDRAGHIPNSDEPLDKEDTHTKYYSDYISNVIGITFRVEAIRIKRMLANKAIAEFEDLLLEQTPDDQKYAYMFGLYKSLDDALIARRNLIQYNFKDPQIIPYLNGSRISEQQARFLIDEFAELDDLIRFIENKQ